MDGVFISHVGTVIAPDLLPLHQLPEYGRPDDGVVGGAYSWPWDTEEAVVGTHCGGCWAGKPRVLRCEGMYGVFVRFTWWQCCVGGLGRAWFV